MDKWELSRVSRVPEAWRGRVQREYARRMARVAELPAGRGRRTKAEQAANAWLDDVAGIFARVRFAPGVTEGDIRDKAAECAAAAWALAEIVPGVLVPDVAALRARLAGYVETFGVVPPGEKIKDGPAVSRMTSPLWWRRALRVAQARQLERGAITLGYVHKKAEIYASDATVIRRAEQRRRNAAMLEQTKAENLDTGDVFTLAQLAAASVANPTIRRGELMTRIAGFEAVARGLGHVAEFVTLTAPSRFHRMRKAASGYIEPNPKHDGSSPRDAARYLGRVWARIRARLARLGLRVYGFRIAEPHHDACPHWHILLFMPEWLRQGARSVPRFRAVFRRYALAIDRELPTVAGLLGSAGFYKLGLDMRLALGLPKTHAGALLQERAACQVHRARVEARAAENADASRKKHGVTFEAIDWNKGSAAGYVAKYIAKNIDGAAGYQVQGDIEGPSMDAIYPGQRVEAWASTWGIRQFQQVGGPPVGVWRELRRMEQAESLPALLNSAIAAADCGKNGKDENGTAGNWRRYVEIMGGPVVARAALPFRVAYRDKPGKVDTVTGEMSKARTVYGDDAAPVPCGVRYVERVRRVEGIAVYLAAVEMVAESKRQRWAIKRGSDAGANKGFSVGRFAGGAGGEGFAGLVGGGFSGFEGGEAGRTRTRVNNCTHGDKAGPFCLVDFEWMRTLQQGKGGKNGINGQRATPREVGGGGEGGTGRQRGQKRGGASAAAGGGAPRH